MSILLQALYGCMRMVFFCILPVYMGLTYFIRINKIFILLVKKYCCMRICVFEDVGLSKESCLSLWYFYEGKMLVSPWLVT